MPISKEAWERCRRALDTLYGHNPCNEISLTSIYDDEYFAAAEYALASKWLQRYEEYPMEFPPEKSIEEKMLDAF